MSNKIVIFGIMGFCAAVAAWSLYVAWPYIVGPSS